MVILPVKVRLKGSSCSVATYAFIDSGSNVSFCAEKLMYKLGAHGKPVKLHMDTMGDPCVLRSRQIE